METQRLCDLSAAIVAATFDVALEDLTGQGRGAASVAGARHVAIYLANVVFQLPMSAVADGFGRERTSVGHALRRVEDRRDDAGFDQRLERLEHLALLCARPLEPQGDTARGAGRTRP